MTSELATPPEFVIPPIPEIPPDRAAETNNIYALHRTTLAEQRTTLAVYRTTMAGARTDMALHRTRMAADRTLMAIMRTSLSLIGFGFTISQAFQRLMDSGVIKSGDPAHNFGMALILLGILLQAAGIIYHLAFMRGLRADRNDLVDQKLVTGTIAFPVSLTLLTAVIMLLIGLTALLSLIFRIGPFS